MSKNIMRTPEEKEKLVLEMINNGYGFHTMSKKHDISKSVLSKWYYSYKEKGIEGLKSNTGMGKDHTLYAKINGNVKFERKGKDKKQVSVYEN